MNRNNSIRMFFGTVAIFALTAAFFLYVPVLTQDGVQVSPVVAHAFGTSGDGGCCGGSSGGGSSGGGGGSNSYTPPKPKPSCTISANPSNIQYAGSTTLSWASTNATSATLSGIGSVGVNGSHFASGIITTTTYTLTVSGPGGTANCHKTVTVTQPQAPACSISANPSSIQNGGSSTLTWSSTNATSASLNQGIGSVALSGSNSVVPAVTTTYTMTVSGQGGTVNCHTTITVTQPQVPACSISANPSSIQNGGSSTLTWSSSNATSASLNQGIGSVTTSGSRSVSPTNTTTYILTVSGQGGTVNCETVVIVQQQQAPSCSISANPSNVQNGGSSTLTWSSTNATSASINQGIGSVALNGSYVAPNIYSTTVYTLTVSGPGGTANCQTTVQTSQVVPLAPSCTISANPSNVQNGGSSYLSWSSSNASSANLSTIGSVGVNGNYTVYPQTTTAYVLTVYGSQGQSAQCQTSVFVNSIIQQAPSCWITLTPQYGYGTTYNYNYNQQGTLSWGSNNANSASISPNVGSVSTSGSRLVPLSTYSMYTMTVYGIGGTATCQTSAQVVPPPTYYPPQVALTQIPYTGIDLGEAGTALYWLAFISFALAALYLLVYYKGGGAKAFAGGMVSLLAIRRRAR